MFALLARLGWLGQELFLLSSSLFISRIFSSPSSLANHAEVSRFQQGSDCFGRGLWFDNIELALGLGGVMVGACNPALRFCSSGEGLAAMGSGVSEWLIGFLRKRRLEEPDGRPLYAYRCSEIEFEKAACELTAAVQDRRLGPWDIRAFVLYASQWWQRRYSGGPWCWEPVLRDVGWGDIDFPDLYPHVRQALQWWRVKLVRMSGTTRYLGTFAVQGGLPLRLVGDAGPVTAYLRAVVRHVAKYRKFVDDPVELARDQQHLLRQRTLRREHVFRLAADLVDAVLDLREFLGQSDDPLAELDARRSKWRESMPLDIDSDTARQLLEGLLREAKAGSPSGSGFGIERFLVQTEVGWRLGARLRMPRSIERGDLGEHLRVPEGDLPPRMHVRIAGESGRMVGLYGAGGECFHLMSGENNPITSFWDDAATDEFYLEFFAQDVVGKVKPRRSAPLGELPWVFRVENGECALIGEGSISDRAPELLALIPTGCEPSVGEALGATVVNRRLWRISEPVVVETDSGACEIKPASEQMVEEDYWLSGDRCYTFASMYPLFRGQPRLMLSKAEGTPRSVPPSEVGWRSTGGRWQQLPDGFGVWEVRHVQGGVLRHHGRLGLLPDALNVAVEPSSESEGHLVFAGGEDVGVACDADGLDIEIERAAKEIRIRLTAVDTRNPPAEVALRLYWPGARELRVWTPFPGAGGRFLRNGEPLAGRTLALGDLYGVRATALSTDETQRYWIDGELRAEDAGPVMRVAHFRHALRKSGARYELALIEVDSTLRLLLGASSAPDARVSLRIVDRAQREYGAVEVRRFASVLEYDPEMASVLVQPPLEHGGVPIFEALPLARTDVEPVTLSPIGPPTAPVCARLPDELISSAEPWLVVLRGDDGVRAEPVVVCGESSSLEATPTLSLRESLTLAHASERSDAVDAALKDMVADGDEPRHEADWEFLNEMLLCLEGVPSSASELISALPRCPQALVRCLFRLEPSLRPRIWQLDDDLPFSWLLINRQVWRREARIAFAAMCDELRKIEHPERIASQYVLSVLEDGAKRINALDTLVADIGVALEGGELSDAFVQMVREERDRQRQQYVQLLASQDEWPQGYTRRDWSDELKKPQLSKLPIWDAEHDRKRQPTFDTPVAAAWCCFVSGPSARTPFLVKRMRAYAPDWFDIAYRAAWYELARIQDRPRKNRND